MRRVLLAVLVIAVFVCAFVVISGGKINPPRYSSGAGSQTNKMCALSSGDCTDMIAGIETGSNKLCCASGDCTDIYAETDGAGAQTLNGKNSNSITKTFDPDWKVDFPNPFDKLFAEKSCSNKNEKYAMLGGGLPKIASGIGTGSLNNRDEGDVALGGGSPKMALADGDTICGGGSPRV